MITVCKQHVNQGLKMIFLPHIQPIHNEEKLTGDVKCQVCSQNADYKLYNFERQRRHKQAI
ncbi:hypothetical protein M3182_21325 [Mesobacillus maritimus]|uniref:hypothetical protein n=1 Tax=Mesobacillus maritimus TaxID=1643336 RepID=UPI00203D03FA|nr:hypothetical protein [Mesobacillus maritimus]MCM3588248.1 hypothetical protein [Mesobacillus maritimus]MCM3668292.1 hypothetical protein [Mesobacillus maritimus]